MNKLSMGLAVLNVVLLAVVGFVVLRKSSDQIYYVDSNKLLGKTVNDSVLEAPVNRKRS